MCSQCNDSICFCIFIVHCFGGTAALAAVLWSASQKGTARAAVMRGSQALQAEVARRQRAVLAPEAGSTEAAAHPLERQALLR